MRQRTHGVRKERKARTLQREDQAYSVEYRQRQMRYEETSERNSQQREVRYERGSVMTRELTSNYVASEVSPPIALRCSSGKRLEVKALN